MRALSRPVRMKIGQRMSRRKGAARRTPSEARGTTAFEANPTAACPMNIRAPYSSGEEFLHKGRDTGRAEARRRVPALRRLVARDAGIGVVALRDVAVRRGPSGRRVEGCVRRAEPRPAGCGARGV